MEKRIEQLENKTIALEARVVILEGRLKTYQEWVELTQKWCNDQVALNKILSETVDNYILKK